MENYFYLNEQNEQKGPVTPEELIRNGITKNTMVWKNGMAQWMQAGEVPEINQLFTSATTPPPYPPVPPRVTPTPPPTPSVPAQKPDNWLVWAILSTVLCCLPLGVVSIIYATKVDNLWNAGQYAEAEKASGTARLFCFLSLGGGVLALIIGIISGVASALMGSY